MNEIKSSKNCFVLIFRYQIFTFCEAEISCLSILILLWFDYYSLFFFIRIYFLGSRILPSSGELLVPLPVLRARAQPETSSSKLNKTSTESQKDVVLKTLATPEKKKQKMSVETNHDGNTSLKSSKNSSPSSKSKPSSSKDTNDSKLCVVNKEKSFFHDIIMVENEDKPEKKDVRTSEPVVISDDDLDFDFYSEIKCTKKKKSVPMIVVSDSE